jgi:hypothetical protein
MKNFHALIIFLLLLISVPVIAQDEVEEEEGKLSFSGSADVYFRKNFNGPTKGEFAQSPATSFGNLPGFSLGMLNLITKY